MISINYLELGSVVLLFSNYWNNYKVSLNERKTIMHIKEEYSGESVKKYRQ